MITLKPTDPDRHGDVAIALCEWMVLAAGLVRAHGFATGASQYTDGGPSIDQPQPRKPPSASASGSSGEAPTKRDRAVAARQEAEERVREVRAAKDARKLSPASSKPTDIQPAAAISRRRFVGVGDQ